MIITITRRGRLFLGAMSCLALAFVLGTTVDRMQMEKQASLRVVLDLASPTTWAVLWAMSAVVSLMALVCARPSMWYIAIGYLLALEWTWFVAILIARFTQGAALSVAGITLWAWTSFTLIMAGSGAAFLQVRPDPDAKG